MRDEITGLYWYNNDGTTRTWEDSITYCDTLSQGSGSWTDWRLATQKELMQAPVFDLDLNPGPH